MITRSFSTSSFTSRSRSKHKPLGVRAALLSYIIFVSPRATSFDEWSLPFARGVRVVGLVQLPLVAESPSASSVDVVTFTMDGPAAVTFSCGASTMVDCRSCFDVVVAVMKYWMAAVHFSFRLPRPTHVGAT